MRGPLSRVLALRLCGLQAGTFSGVLVQGAGLLPLVFGAPDDGDDDGPGGATHSGGAGSTMGAHASDSASFSAGVRAGPNNACLARIHACAEASSPTKGASPRSSQARDGGVHREPSLRWCVKLERAFSHAPSRWGLHVGQTWSDSVSSAPCVSGRRARSGPGRGLANETPLRGRSPCGRVGGVVWFGGVRGGNGPGEGGLVSSEGIGRRSPSTETLAPSSRVRGGGRRF